MKNQKPKHGGDREGSGRPPKYGKVKTRSLQRIVPKDKFDQIAAEVDKIIDQICGKNPKAD